MYFRVLSVAVLVATILAEASGHGADRRIITMPDATLNAHPHIADPEDHFPRITALAVGRDERFASAGLDRAIRLWSSVPVEQMVDNVIVEPKQRIECLAFSRDGSVLAAGGRHDYRENNTFDENGQSLIRSEGCVYIRDVGVLHQSSVLVTHDSVVSLGFGACDHYLAVGTDAGECKVWKKQMGPGVYPAYRVFTLKHAPVPCRLEVCFSPDGSIIATASEGAVKLWRLNDSEPFKVVEGRLPVAFDRRGSRFAYMSRDLQTIRIMHMGQGSEMESLSIPRRALSEVYAGAPWQCGSVDFSADGRYLFQGHRRLVSAWKLSSKSIVAIIDTEVDAKEDELVGNVLLRVSHGGDLLYTYHEYATDFKVWRLSRMLDK